MNINVIIPARYGSKRLKGKNIRKLNEKPLIEYSIEFAINNNILPKNIIVSTNDNEVKFIANKYGLSIIDRPEYLCGDLVSTLDVLKHAIEIYSSSNWIVLLQPTNPLRPINLLKEAFSVLKTNEYDSLFTVSENHQKFGKIIDSKFIPFNYSFGQRSQDLEPLFFENGLLYITHPDLIRNGQILGNRAFPMIVDHPFAKVDIDTIEDFKFAEFTLNNYK